MDPANYPIDKSGEIDLILLGKLVDWNNPSELENMMFSGSPDYQKLIGEVIASPFIAKFRWKYGSSALHYAIGANQNELAKLLVQNGADVNAYERGIGCPIHGGAECDNLVGIKLLLDCGADVNTLDRWGRTPLHLAAYSGDHSVVELLLAHGAAVNTPDGDGETPLDAAIRARREDVERILRESGAKTSGIKLD